MVDFILDPIVAISTKYIPLFNKLGSGLEMFKTFLHRRILSLSISYRQEVRDIAMPGDIG